MSIVRVLRVRCSTWGQVEAFYRRKLRKSGRLSMKVPFECEVGTPVTLGLELPNQIVIAIDGTVSTVGASLGGRTTIDVSLFGLSTELLLRLETLVAEAYASASADDADLDDEHRLLAARSSELRRQQRLAAHEIVGVPRDPSAVELRAAWIALARREHPDAVARFASPALSAVAEECMILAARAYDRMRAVVVADGRGVAVGPSVRPPPAWSGLDDPMASGFFAEALTPPVDDGVELVDASRSHRLPSADLLSAFEVAESSGALPLPSFEDLLPPAVSPVAAAGSAGVRWSMAGDLFSDLDLEAGPATTGAAPIAVEESLAQARSGPGDRFVKQIRARLGAGDHGGAREVAEAALQVYATDRRVRGLLHVATAMAACVRADRTAAMSELEAALTHDPACLEAATALDQLRRASAPSAPAIQRLFT